MKIEELKRDMIQAEIDLIKTMKTLAEKYPELNFSLDVTKVEALAGGMLLMFEIASEIKR